METIEHFIRTLGHNAHVREAGKLVVYMIIGGGIGLYVRMLYLRFGLAVANRDSLSSNFSILVITTVLIIFVVKSSLALSLGLVGALSIVRFRAAIKEPEELVMLFFCIAAGLALGAEYAELAIGGVFVFSIFVVLRHWCARRGGMGDSLLLTISGPRATLMDGDPQRLIGTVRQAVGPFKVQRLDVEDGQVQLRAVVVPDEPEKLVQVVESLRSQLPGCSVSYVSLSDLL